MIKELIATLMISSGVAYGGNPSFNKKPENRLDTNYTNFSLQPNKIATTFVNSTQEQNGITKTTRHEKTNWNGYNQALNTYASLTIETTKFNTDDSDQFRPGESNPTWGETPNIINGYYDTNALLAIQITPYQYLYDANAVINYYLTAYISSSTLTRNNHIQVDIITSIDTDWRNYIDTTNYGTSYWNYNTFSNLVSAENGYLYNSYQQNLYFTMEPNQQTNQLIYIDQDIELVAENTNYIYIMLTPIFDSLGATASSGKYKTIGANWINTKEWLTGEKSITLSGIMIIPPSTYEVIDMPGLLFEIVVMPFTFISTAFNLTLFPGTPYQLNLSNLFLTILGVLIFIFIIRIIVKNRMGA